MNKCDCGTKIGSPNSAYHSDWCSSLKPSRESLESLAVNLEEAAQKISYARADNVHPVLFDFEEDGVKWAIRNKENADGICSVSTIPAFGFFRLKQQSNIACYNFSFTDSFSSVCLMTNKDFNDKKTSRKSLFLEDLKGTPNSPNYWTKSVQVQIVYPVVE